MALKKQTQRIIAAGLVFVMIATVLAGIFGSSGGGGSQTPAPPPPAIDASF